MAAIAKPPALTSELPVLNAVSSFHTSDDGHCVAISPLSLLCEPEHDTYAWRKRIVRSGTFPAPLLRLSAVDA